MGGSAIWPCPWSSQGSAILLGVKWHLTPGQEYAVGMQQNGGFRKNRATIADVKKAQIFVTFDYWNASFHHGGNDAALHKCKLLSGGSIRRHSENSDVGISYLCN